VAGGQWDGLVLAVLCDTQQALSVPTFGQVREQIAYGGGVPNCSLSICATSHSATTWCRCVRTAFGSLGSDSGCTYEQAGLRPGQRPHDPAHRLRRTPSITGVKWVRSAPSSKSSAWISASTVYPGVEKHAAIKHLRRGTSSWSDRDDSVGTF
jgi:hypothetical protein